MFVRISNFLREECFRGYLTYNPGITALVIFFMTISSLCFFRPFFLYALPNLLVLALSLGISVIAVFGYGSAYILFRPYMWKQWNNLQELITYFTAFLIMWLPMYFYTLFCIEYLAPIKFKMELDFQLPRFFFFHIFWDILGMGIAIPVVHLGQIYFYIVDVPSEHKVVKVLDCCQRSDL